MLALVGVLVHVAGARWIHRILPPAVTGAVVMLIGFNLAPVVAGIYWPQDQWVALLTAAFMVAAAVMLPGFWSRIAVFLALIFGFVLSWLADVVLGPITSVLRRGHRGHGARPGLVRRGQGGGLGRPAQRRPRRRGVGRPVRASR